MDKLPQIDCDWDYVQPQTNIHRQTVIGIMYNHRQITIDRLRLGLCTTIEKFPQIDCDWDYVQPQTNYQRQTVNGIIYSHRKITIEQTMIGIIYNHRQIIIDRLILKLCPPPSSPGCVSYSWSVTTKVHIGNEVKCNTNGVTLGVHTIVQQVIVASSNRLNSFARV